MHNSKTLGTTSLLLSTASGIALLGLLPVGLYVGIGSTLFSAISILHGILQVVALLTTLLFIVRIAATNRTLQLGSAVVTLLVLGGILLLGFLPITARDALIHHLAVPKWWVETGSIYPISWHEWSYYPMLLDLGYTALLQHGLTALTPFYHASFLFLLAGTVAIVLTRVGQGAAQACAGYCLALTIPIAFKLATIPVVDLGLALYVTISLAALVCWSEHGASRWAVFAGVALGLALGCKYNGLLVASVVAPLTLILGIRSGLSQPRSICGVLLLGVFTTALFLPWAIKNMLWVGNPIYPLFNHLFLDNFPSSPVRGLSPLEQRLMLYKESWLEIALTPLRMLYAGVDENPRRFDGVLAPILFFALLSLRGVSRKPWVLFLALFSLIYFLIAQVYAAPRVRYLAPLYGPLSILTITGIFSVGDLIGRSKRRLLSILFAAHAAWFGWYLFNLIEREGALPYLTSGASSEDYLRAHLREYSAIDFINQNTSSDAKVYLLFTGNKYFLFRRVVQSTGHYSGSELFMASSVQNLEARFKELGITHLMANTELLSISLSSSAPPYSQEVWESFRAQHLEQIFSSNPFVVWKMR